MLSTSVHSRNSSPPSNSLFELPSFQINIVKISQVATACFFALICADLALRAGGFLIGLGLLASPVVWMVGGSILVALLVIAGGIYAYHKIKQYYRYEDPAKLNAQKKEAIHLDFYQLCQIHTLKNLIHYIFNEKEGDLSFGALQRKFKEEIVEKSIDFLQLYDLEKLENSQIISKEFASEAKELQEEMDAIKENSCRELEKLDKIYPQRTDKIRNNAMRTEGPLRDIWKSFLPSNLLGSAAMIPISVTVGAHLDDEFSGNPQAHLQQDDYAPQRKALLQSYNEKREEVENKYRKLVETHFPNH